jgi:cysteine desulfurase
MNNVYLDFAATTPIDPEVLESMLPYFTEQFGNPSSTHQHGQKAEAVVEESREIIAELMACSPSEIIFTSGGSEADNLAIRGTALFRRREMGANRILISPVEHEAVQKTARQLRDIFNFQLEYIPVDSEGKIILDEFKKMAGYDIAIVSVIYGNNEIGTINQIEEIGQICAAYGIPFHSDAVQAMGYLDLKANENIKLLSAGAHKFYGPKGVGFLYKNKSTKLISTQTGGAQEGSLRAGTHNVSYIVGMAKALQITRSHQEEFIQHYSIMRNLIINGVMESTPNARLTGSLANRLCNHASFVFSGVDGNGLVMALDLEGYSCSSGSACKTGNPEPSDVLLAIGMDPILAKGSLRLSVGRSTTVDQVNQFVNAFSGIMSRLVKQ